MDNTTLCDQCGVEIPVEEAHACEFCGGTYCEAHIDRPDHDCITEQR